MTVAVWHAWAGRGPAGVLTSPRPALVPPSAIADEGGSSFCHVAVTGDPLR